MIYLSLLILTASILIPFKAESSNELWSKVVSPTTHTFFNCSFVDSLNGWAAGDSGIIVHTSNGGSSFVIQTSSVDYFINDIFFINKRLGWAVANQFLLNGTTILKTTNGGLKWMAEIFPDSNKIFRTVYFLDSLNGFLAGLLGSILKTTDAGVTWIETKNDSSSASTFPITKLKFANEYLGFACGGYHDISGVIWKTTNGGMFWVAEALSPEPFFSIYIKDSLRILAVGGDYEYGVQLTSTTNSGITWNYKSLKLFGQGESIDFRTPREGWMALSFAATWAVSYDSGATWSDLPVINNSVIKSVTFSDSLHGWAFGSNGVILKYNPKSVGLNNEVSEVPSSFLIEQNYPNPFNPNTVISYQLSVGSFTSLKVFDILGNEVKTLVHQKQNAGSYKVEFKGNNLSSGIYYYKIWVSTHPGGSGKYSETKRMVLLK